jgi:hypothetical protein
MTKMSKKTRITVIISGLLVVAFAVLIVTGNSASDSSAQGRGSCIKSQKPVTVAKGVVPGGAGKEWAVASSLRSAKNCSGVLLTMKFKPSGTRRGSWRETRYKPPPGEPTFSPPNSPEISAQDGVAPVGRVFSGFVSSNVSKVHVTFDDGSSLIIRPKGVGRQLVRKYPWLKEVKYFVDFYRQKRKVRDVVVSGPSVESPAPVFSEGAGEFSTY